MAGGNLTPRQKMINLMYLVFIAMLAMNMSKQVLSAFGYMKEKLTASNLKVSASNEATLNSLESKAVENPGKYKDKYGQGKEIKKVSDNFFEYINTVKKGVTPEKFQGEHGRNYEAMDGDQDVNAYFFGVNDSYSEQGQEFVDKINGYREDLYKIMGDSLDPVLKKQIEERFSTLEQNPEEGHNAGKTVPWLINRYKGFPLITALTNLTQIQADIRTTQAELYNSLLGATLLSESKMSNYKAIVALDKTAYFSGETVTGKIVLGKYDASLDIQNFESNVGGKAENGQINLEFEAGNAGEHPIKGFFEFQQKEGGATKLEFESNYTVITEPSGAVISADKMNVVYRGLKNPMSISVPGIGDDNIKVSAPGLKKVGSGKYVMTPKTGKDVNIRVTATLPSGKTINTNKKFRIKDVPAPMGALRGKTGRTGMPKESLQRTSVDVILQDFAYDLKFQVTGFSVKVPGQATIVVSGSRMDSRAKSAISKARRGDQVNIFDVKSKIIGSGSGLRVKPASPILVEIK